MFGKEQPQLNVLEGHSLWDLLSSKYHEVDRIQIWLSFAHDPDLKYILKQFLKDLDEHINLLEKELKKYSITGPSRHRKSVRTQTDTQVVADEHIAIDYYTFLQEITEMAVLVYQNSTTNDALRNFFIKFLKHATDQSNVILKYLKTKGWIDKNPLYLNIPPDIKEQINCAEAFHLWAHLRIRYANIDETEKWNLFANDVDFKAILIKGLNTLKDQVIILEKELDHFGIPFPKRPPAVIDKDVKQSIFEDEYIYKYLFHSMHGLGTLHAQAFKRCVTNDRVRNIFYKFLYTEMSYMDNLIKFGNLKGWLDPAPLYKA